MKNALTNTTNPNNPSNINNNNNKALNEHKLLNGLLSKPLTTTPNSASNQSEQPQNGNAYNTNNSQNSLLMPSNVNAPLEHILKINNKLNSQRSNSLTNGNNVPGGKQQHYEAEMLNYSKSNNSLLNLIGQEQQQSLQSKLHQSPPKEALFAANSRQLGSNGSSISSMEANMLEFILSEIDSCVENKESVNRLRQMITQMHVYFNEKLNELQSNRSKLIAEFDEVDIFLIWTLQFENSEST